MFTRDEENIRELKINIGYNLERLSIPTIHILMPTDSKGAEDSIGLNEFSEFTPGTIDPTTGILTVKKEKSYNAVYHLMITSDNMSEVLLIFYWLRNMIIVFSEHFELLGLRNLQFSGQDINIQQDLTPPHIFHRNLSLQFDYVSEVKIDVSKETINGIKFGFCTGLKNLYEQYSAQHSR